MANFFKSIWNEMNEGYQSAKDSFDAAAKSFKQGEILDGFGNAAKGVAKGAAHTATLGQADEIKDFAVDRGKDIWEVWGVATDTLEEAGDSFSKGDILKGISQGVEGVLSYPGAVLTAGADAEIARRESKRESERESKMAQMYNHNDLQNVTKNTPEYDAAKSVLGETKHLLKNYDNKTPSINSPHDAELYTKRQATSSGESSKLSPTTEYTGNPTSSNSSNGSSNSSPTEKPASGATITTTEPCSKTTPVINSPHDYEMWIKSHSQESPKAGDDGITIEGDTETPVINSPHDFKIWQEKQQNQQQNQWRPGTIDIEVPNDESCTVDNDMELG